MMTFHSPYENSAWHEDRLAILQRDEVLEPPSSRQPTAVSQLALLLKPSRTDPLFIPYEFI